MRDAINNNPVVQACLVGVLLLVAVVMLAPQLMHKSDSGSSGGAQTTTSSAQLTTPTGSVNVTAEVSGTPSVPGVSEATGAAASGVAPQSATVDPSALLPGTGLPRPVVRAWHRGDTIVLLVVREGGVDDRLVRQSVEALSAPGTAVFVIRASRIARYSRITQGVGVSQVPALVIVRPRRLSGSVPQAQVSYGFRSSQAVVQAVHDALYSGKDNLPYSPR
jgi:hypothetical protein